MVLYNFRFTPYYYIVYFKHQVVIMGLAKLYGKLHIYFEERENPEKNSGKGEEGKISYLGGADLGITLL